VIARDRSYHGATYLAMALSGDTRTRAQVDAQALGIRHVPPPYAYRCPFGTQNERDCGDQAARAVDECIAGEGAGNVVAVAMESNAGSNGIVAPDNYWPELRRVASSHGVWLLADEVMSAFGRCGQWFAWQRHGEAGRPDAMTLAKGLTGAAVPLGAVVIAREISERLEHRSLQTGLTYCGHPLACAAGLAALRAYEDERLIERSRRMGPALLAELERLQTKHPVIGDVRGGHGLFAVVELVKDRTTREPLAPWPQTPTALTRLLADALAEGVSFGARGNLLLIAPPLVIGERELADGLAVLDRLLQRHFAG
jgi:taurine--2-oxoglutarate transaminase